MAALTLLVLGGCASTPRPAEAPAVPAGQAAAADEHFARLHRGVDLLMRRKLPRKAIDEYFDPVIAEAGCERLLEGEPRTYVARTPAESVFYLVQAARQDLKAVVVRTPCADAFYLKGYALLDLGDVEGARAAIERAVALAPRNAQYLAELGHIHHVERDWEGALTIFTLAEDSARSFSPEDARLGEVTRALRGMGFSLIELGRLNEAELRFRESLQLDPDDEAAQQELAYIEQLREQAAHAPE
ncbi:MAG: tetratricopeptide repeat protein [Gammaproteobacteria bacterium]|nr:MAG: tetratricopeptide repeat protein [Gammaproteobacteria bacterium]